MREPRKLEWWERYKLQGEARLLRRLIERRFGTRPAWADQQLATAREEKLISWGQEILGTTLSLEQLSRTQRMSNHSGSYMLNGFLHGLVDSGILKNISATQKKSIRRLLRSAVVEYDCNWPEIVDVELSVLLAACSCCGCESTEINTDNGYCVRCDPGMGREGRVKSGGGLSTRADSQ
jgi:hypothetical protein